MTKDQLKTLAINQTCMPGITKQTKTTNNPNNIIKKGNVTQHKRQNNPTLKL